MEVARTGGDHCGNDHALGPVRERFVEALFGTVITSLFMVSVNLRSVFPRLCYFNIHTAYLFTEKEKREKAGLVGDVGDDNAGFKLYRTYAHAHAHTHTHKHPQAGREKINIHGL